MIIMQNGKVVSSDGVNYLTMRKSKIVKLFWEFQNITKLRKVRGKNALDENISEEGELIMECRLNGNKHDQSNESEFSLSKTL